MTRDLKGFLFGLIATIVLGIVLIFLGISTSLPGPDSEETLKNDPGEIISMAHGLYRTDTLVSVIGSTTRDVSDPIFTSSRESFVELLKKITDMEGKPIFSSVKTLGHSWAQEDLFVSNDKHNLLVIAETNEIVHKSPNLMKRILSDIDRWRSENSAFSLFYSSSGVISNELFALINYDLDTSLKYTVPITAIILIWTFGTLGSSFLAMTVTALSLISALGVSSLLSHLVHPLSATAAQLVVLIVMAIGTDYALFYIARLRQEIRAGAGLREALLKTSRTTGIAIIWSGITVAASLSGLLLVGDPILTSMAAVSIVAVIITLIFTLKFLPCLLVIFQRLIEWGRVRSFSESIAKGDNRWVLRSVQYPRLSLALSLLFLLSIGYFCAKMNLGSTMQARLMPQKMQSSQAIEIIDKLFPQFSGTDLTLILNADNLRDKDSNEELELFFEQLQLEERLHGPLSIHWSADGKVARYDYRVKGTSQDQANRKLLEKLRIDLIPNYLVRSGVNGFISGKLNFDLEQEDFHKKKLFIVLISILGASLIFLMMAFESLVIPIKALLLNALSTSAAFGVLVLLFQLFGWRYGVIESFVPALLFSILFGLSMDYHLLLISRVQEYVRDGFKTRDAVVRAISETYGIISGAAVIMTSVFIVISFLELPLMKQLGIGLACAIILDATIVRCVLLPASVILLGERNWYLPKFLKAYIKRVKELHSLNNKPS